MCADEDAAVNQAAESLQSVGMGDSVPSLNFATLAGTQQMEQPRPPTTLSESPAMSETMSQSGVPASSRSSVMASAAPSDATQASHTDFIFVKPHMPRYKLEEQCLQPKAAHACSSLPHPTACIPLINKTYEREVEKINREFDEKEMEALAHEQHEWKVSGRPLS